MQPDLSLVEITTQSATRFDHTGPSSGVYDLRNLLHFITWPTKAVCVKHIRGNGRNTLASNIKLASRYLDTILSQKSPNLSQPVSTRSSRLLSMPKFKRAQFLQQPQQIYLCLTSCEPNATFLTATSNMQFLKTGGKSLLPCLVKPWNITLTPFFNPRLTFIFTTSYLSMKKWRVIILVADFALCVATTTESGPGLTSEPAQVTFRYCHFLVKF